MPEPSSPAEFVGIDVGGTFTDFVWLVDGRLRVHKVATTPADQSRGIEAGLDGLGVSPAARVVHGTTAATNALLEQRGARTALLTTEGFSDVLAIGRQNRPHLYRLAQHRLPPLVPTGLRLGIPERLDADGHVVTPLDEGAVVAAARRLREAQVESVAIAFLFAFRNGAHERRAAALLAEHLPGIPVSCSSDLLPEYREYERTATTAINAFVRPLVGRYFGRLEEALAGRPVRVMQSNGGTIGPTRAAEEAARLVLSGPAGGVVGAYAWAQRATGEQTPPVLTFDMGGTSTDVALCPGAIPRTAESTIAGLPLRLPSVDIHTVGAGGGSVARVDVGGVLRVGPESAGADPGPACYGRGGTEATVSDANLVLGRLDPAAFLGGAGPLRLDPDAARSALGRLGQRLGLSAEAAATGVLRVANATMERALRRVSVERGHDPRGYLLVPFGGAGPLHACDLAAALGLRRVLVPPNPGVLSALGLLLADVTFDASRAVLADADALIREPAPLGETLDALAAEVGEALRAEGVDAPRLAGRLDLRYRGQSYELDVPVALPAGGPAVARAVGHFHEEHARRYGYAREGAAVEIVAARVRGTGPGLAPELAPEPVAAAAAAADPAGERTVWFDGRPLPTARYLREHLRPGHTFDGPALVLQYDTTTVVPPGWRGQVDGWGNVWLEG